MSSVSDIKLIKTDFFFFFVISLFIMKINRSRSNYTLLCNL